MATQADALKWVEKLNRQLIAQQEIAREPLEYLNGQQPLKFATASWSKFHAERFKGFSDNWCGVVANTPVRRLRIDGIRIGEDLDPLSKDERDLFDDWKRNDLDTFSKQGFLMSVAATRSYTITWIDEKSKAPVTTWETPLEVTMEWDATGRRALAALKVWDDPELDATCATLYLPTETWKFKRNRIKVDRQTGATPGGILIPSAAMVSIGGWEPREVPGEKWPLPNPAGEVLVSEYPNRPFLTGQPLSDIQGTMAMQNALNLLWAYLFTGLDHASMPARIVLGAEPPQVPILDNLGQITGWRASTQEDLVNGRVLFIPRQSKDAATNPTTASWDAANLDVFTGVMSQAVGHVAAQTSTPAHYLNANEKMANLNGDALTAAEVPLVDKVGDMQMGFNRGAKGTFRHMALVRDNKAIADQITVGRVQWKDAAMHSVGQIADAAGKDKAAGLSMKTILRIRYGMSPEEIDRELDQIKEEQLDPYLSALAKPPIGAGTPGTQPTNTGGDGGDVAAVGSVGA